MQLAEFDQLVLTGNLLLLTPNLETLPLGFAVEQDQDEDQRQHADRADEDHQVLPPGHLLLLAAHLQLLLHLVEVEEDLVGDGSQCRPRNTG